MLSIKRPGVQYHPPPVILIVGHFLTVNFFWKHLDNKRNIISVLERQETISTLSLNTIFIKQLMQISFSFLSKMCGLSSCCHPGLKIAISAQHGPIILPSSWVVRLTVSVRAIILLSSYRQWVIAVVETSFCFRSRHPGVILVICCF